MGSKSSNVTFIIRIELGKQCESQIIVWKTLSLSYRVIDLNWTIIGLLTLGFSKSFLGFRFLQQVGKGNVVESRLEIDFNAQRMFADFHYGLLGAHLLGTIANILAVGEGWCFALGVRIQGGRVHCGTWMD